MNTRPAAMAVTNFKLPLALSVAHLVWWVGLPQGIITFGTGTYTFTDRSIVLDKDVTLASEEGFVRRLCVGMLVGGRGMCVVCVCVSVLSVCVSVSKSTILRPPTPVSAVKSIVAIATS